MRAAESCDGSTQEFNVALRIKRNPQTSLAPPPGSHHYYYGLDEHLQCSTLRTDSGEPRLASFGRRSATRKVWDRGLPPSESWASVPDDPHAAELAEKALKDPSSLLQVRLRHPSARCKRREPAQA